MSPSAHALQVLWRRALRRLGASGMAGLLLLLLALALALWAPRVMRDAATLRLRLHGAQREMAQAQQARLARVSPAQQAEAFASGFPPLSHNAADLQAVFAAAERHHVALPKGDYQLVAEPDAAFVTYAATFPVREPYTSVKAFTADVLQSLPHAAMDELRLERGDAGSERVDARIRISLVYRAPAVPATPEGGS